MILKIKRLHPDAKLPSFVHAGDAGLDVYAIEEKIINPGERALLMNGFAMEIPDGYAAIVKDKSSTSRAGLHTMGGVFDAGYRGEYNVQLINLADTPYKVEKGDKIAQIVILKVEMPTIQEVIELSESSRGIGAFGSTGRK